MAERTCHNCVYACGDPGLWLRRMWTGGPVLARCANHPHWPGQLHDVPGVPCRNYRPRPATPDGDVRMIALGDGCYTYVDAADYDGLHRWNWHLDSGYAARYDKRKTVFMHRLIMPPPEGMVVDHIDGNRVNNCRSNLRVCTRAENSRNKRKHTGSSSVFKGVSYSKEKRKWFAKCRYKGRPHRLGYFDDEAEAARAYDRKAVEWFKEFARLNFPAEWPPQRRAELYAQAREPADGDKQSSPHTEPRRHRDDKAKDQKRPKTPKEAKRKTRDAPRTAKRISSHAETQSRRGRKTRDTTRTTTAKGPKRKTLSARRKTKKAASHAGTQRRREGRRTTKSVRPKTAAPKGPEHKTRNAKRKTKGKAAGGGTPSQ